MHLCFPSYFRLFPFFPSFAIPSFSALLFYSSPPLTYSTQTNGLQTLFIPSPNSISYLYPFLPLFLSFLCHPIVLSPSLISPSLPHLLPSNYRIQTLFLTSLTLFPTIYTSHSHFFSRSSFSHFSSLCPFLPLVVSRRSCHFVSFSFHLFYFFSYPSPLL